MNSISARVDIEILNKIDKMATEMHLTRSALIRKFILDGYQRAELDQNLKHVQAGEMSIEQAAMQADVSMYYILELARAKGLVIGLDETTLDYELKSLMKKINQ